ncbi:hypothetical protein BGX33_010249 [Mortierella sp. NVP41]|nr:hypothetical protein BGX33_010249 [Mortierella sp. NVP41]
MAQAFAVEMHVILAACPLLERFNAEVTEFGVTYLLGPWIPAQDDADSSQPQRSLPLRSLILKKAHFQQSSLHALFSRTPQLEELFLGHLVLGDGRAPIESHITVTYNWPDFRQHLQSLSLPCLRSFHFSVQNIPLSDVEFEQMMQVCRSPTPTFWNYDFTPSIVRCLESLPNFITTIDILTDVHTQCAPMRFRQDIRNTQCELLSRYLSESANSFHLRILRAPFFLEHLDLHHRSTLDYGEDSLYYERTMHRRQQVFLAPTSENVPRVWKCRNLHSLRLEVHAHRESELRSAAHSRILLGFISRVVPNLQDLQIDKPLVCASANLLAYSPQLVLHLDGDLCLLARLRYLERLCIRNQTNPRYERCDLNWMIASGHETASRQERQNRMSKWDTFHR